MTGRHLVHGICTFGIFEMRNVKLPIDSACAPLMRLKVHHGRRLPRQRMLHGRVWCGNSSGAMPSVA